MQVSTENKTVQLGCEEGRGGIQTIFHNPLPPHPPTREFINRAHKSCLYALNLADCPAQSRHAKHFLNGQIRQTAWCVSHCVKQSSPELLAKWEWCGKIKNSQWWCDYRREETLSLRCLQGPPWLASSPVPHTHTHSHPHSHTHRHP